MKFIHLSDLHLGKRVNAFSMLPDQRAVLQEILSITETERPDAVLIAGDVYDKSVPPAEAVELFDSFLVGLARLGRPVYLISGNHDSPERLAFANRLLDHTGVHIAPVYGGEIRPFVLEDQYGPVNLYLLPFVKPAHVRRYFPEQDIADYSQALAAAVKAMGVDPAARNVLVTHQFVTGAERSQSEELSVGGTDNVDAAIFKDFDYVALGHLHRPQNVGTEHIRYCGSPLKYSFSEAGDRKSVTVAELGEKGSLTLRRVDLHPERDMVELRGTYEELTQKKFYEGTGWQEDYVHITLTDEDSILDGAARLRVIYHNLMKLDYDNARTRRSALPDADRQGAQKSPLELFGDLYKTQNNAALSRTQRDYLAAQIEKIWEETP